MANETTIGAHRLRIDGDTVLTRYIGVPEHEHVLEIHQHLDRVLAEHGRLYIINDMTRSGMPRPPPGAGSRNGGGADRSPAS